MNSYTRISKIKIILINKKNLFCSFLQEFEIQNYHKRPNSQLSWLCYIIYTKYKNGQEVPAKLNLGGRYTPFRFSRVKSYTQESEFPLQ